MKNVISPLRKRARQFIYWTSLISFTLAIFLIYGIFGDEIKEISKQSPGIRLAIVLTSLLLPPVSAVLLTYYFVFNGYDTNVYLVFKKFEDEKREKEYKKFLETKKQIAETSNQIKELYGILRVFGTDKPLMLGIETRTAIVEGAAPAVYVNDKPVVTKTVDERIVHCLIERAVNADSEIIRIKLGEDDMKFKNPYHINKNCADPIPWQCEGHSEERVIYLPKSYMPYAVESYAYPFVLYINDKYAGEFIGTYESNKEIISIPLGRGVSKSDCQNKPCYIRVPFGKRDKIKLPKPIVILRNGEKVR